jgi:membrane protease YdiL (CAAX protease family)
MSTTPDPLTIVLLVTICLVLGEMLRAFSSGDLLAPPQPRRRLEFDWAVLAVAGVFILLSLIPAVAMLFPGAQTAEKAAEPTPTLRLGAAIVEKFFVIGALLVIMLTRQKNRLTDYGIDFRGFLAEVRYGGLGLLACLPFVIVIMAILGHWRRPETQNPLLILLHESGNESTIVQAVFVAAVAAPLAEELLFRVAFQGNLEARLSAWWAVGIPAVIFPAVHGIYDALPLLPLAITLGVLYHRRRSYVAVVTTHALFNALFLALTLWPRQVS